LLSTEDIVDMKRRVLSILAENRLPPIVTHNMNNDAGDEILNHLRKTNLVNNKDDKVKIIYHPEYLNATNPVFPLDYHQFVRGTHMGIFPSYYEPWGYTPAECTIMGVPSITSNLTGFANYMSRRVSDPEANGIFIVDRRFKSFKEAQGQMANMMWRFCQLSRRERISLRNKTERLSAILSWETLGRHYSKARKAALKNKCDVEISIPDFYERESNRDFD
jgi:glycogen(starch) synthase